MSGGARVCFLFLGLVSAREEREGEERAGVEREQDQLEGKREGRNTGSRGGLGRSERREEAKKVENTEENEVQEGASLLVGERVYGDLFRAL